MEASICQLTLTNISWIIGFKGNLQPHVPPIKMGQRNARIGPSLKLLGHSTWASHFLFFYGRKPFAPLFMSSVAALPGHYILALLTCIYTSKDRISITCESSVVMHSFFYPSFQILNLDRKACQRSFSDMISIRKRIGVLTLSNERY